MQRIINLHLPADQRLTNTIETINERNIAFLESEVVRLFVKEPNVAICMKHLSYKLSASAGIVDPIP